jgi:hypothetical protein
VEALRSKKEGGFFFDGVPSHLIRTTVLTIANVEQQKHKGNTGEKQYGEAIDRRKGGNSVVQFKWLNDGVQILEKSSFLRGITRAPLLRSLPLLSVS